LTPPNRFDSQRFTFARACRYRATGTGRAPAAGDRPRLNALANAPADLKRIFTAPLLGAEAQNPLYDGVCSPSTF